MWAPLRRTSAFHWRRGGGVSSSDSVSSPWGGGGGDPFCCSYSRSGGGSGRPDQPGLHSCCLLECTPDPRPTPGQALAHAGTWSSDGSGQAPPQIRGGEGTGLISRGGTGAHHSRGSGEAVRCLLCSTHSPSPVGLAGDSAAEPPDGGRQSSPEASGAEGPARSRTGGEGSRGTTCTLPPHHKGLNISLKTIPGSQPHPNTPSQGDSSPGASASSGSV